MRLVGTVTGGAASMKDVAARAGVSVGTVSNVLNRPDVVSAAARRRVLEAMAALGYVRNESARQLRAGQSNTIAYVVLDASNPFFTDVARGAQEYARASGVGLYLCNSNQDEATEAAYLEMLLQQRVRGVLITPVDSDGSGLDRLLANGIPIVLVDRMADAATCSVSVDDVIGGVKAVEHLVATGHRRIAYVGGPLTLPQVADRLEGARQALVTAGLPEGALEVVTIDALVVAEGRRAGERIARLPARRRPTAAFCANDLVALGVLQEMTRRGIDVPGGMAIVGYDDIEFASAAAVPLSSVRQPRELLGRTAAELLMDEAERDPAHVHRQVLFQPELVVRASTVAVDRRTSP